MGVMFLALGCVPTVTMQPPQDPLYVGSYVRVPVKAVGVAYDQVAIRVVEGEKGGFISESKDNTFDPTNPHTMLVGGYAPGTYTLEAVNKATNALLGTAQLR